MDYEPLSRIFQDEGQAIRAESSRLARIDVSKLGFLAQRDLPPVVLPVPQNLPPTTLLLSQILPKAAAIPEEEIASSSLSLKEKIDKFHFEEENNPRAPLINISDAEGESDRNFGVHTPILVITCLENSSNEEEDSMVLNKGNNSLRELMVSRGKESTSKVAPKSQVPSNLPLPPPQIPIDLGLWPNPDLKKKWPLETLREGQMGPRKGTKQKKVILDAQDRRSQFVDSWEGQNRADVHVRQRTWSPWLEVDGAPIPWNALVREF